MLSSLKQKLGKTVFRLMPLSMYISLLYHTQGDLYAELMRKEGVSEEVIADPKVKKDYFRCLGSCGISVCYYVHSDMYHITDKKIRDSFVGHARLYGIWYSVNSGPSRQILDNRVSFLKKFSQYLNREWLDVRSSTFSSFKEFCGKHPKMIVKGTTGFGGKGIHLFESSKMNDDELKEVFETYRKDEAVIEEYIVQNGMLHELNPGSLNCCRVCTLRFKDHVEVFQCIIKAGSGDVCVDNTHQGGVYASIDPETGRVWSLYFDDAWIEHESHPASGMKLKGKTIPHWENVKKLVLKAADEVPDLMYVSWDVAISGDGSLYLIEGNSCGDAFWHPDHGYWDRFEKALKSNNSCLRFRIVYCTLIKEHFREIMSYNGSF